MKAFQTTLRNGQIFTVAAFTRTDVPEVLDENGVATREEIVAIRNIGNALDNRPGVYDDAEELVFG